MYATFLLEFNYHNNQEHNSRRGTVKIKKQKRQAYALVYTHCPVLSNVLCSILTVYSPGTNLEFCDYIIITSQIIDRF